MSRTHEIIASLRGEIAALPTVELPPIIGQMATRRGSHEPQQLPRPARRPSRIERGAEDRLLTSEEVAERLGQTSRWVRSHWRDLKARVDLPGRTLRFSEQRLDTYLRNRTRQQ